MNTQITASTAPSIIEQIEKAFFDIPFENSDFQNEAFVIAAQITPERAYRAIGLRLHSKLRALQEAQFSRDLQDIELDELQFKSQDPASSIWDQRRAEVEIKKILSSRAWTDKLINDALREATVLYKHMQALPAYTREQFEAGERLHFEQKLARAVNGISGARESLVNMSDDMTALLAFETTLGLSSPDDSALRALTANMSNIVPAQ